MIYLITALHSEARPLIEHFNLKPDQAYSKPELYVGDGITLAVSRMGRMKSAIATAAVLARADQPEKSIVANVGICGAPLSFQSGEMFMINEVRDDETGRAYYPNIVLKHNLPENGLITYNQPVLDGGSDSQKLVDMEASGFFEAASVFMSPEQIVILKMVSDHMNGERITKEIVSNLVKSHIPEIERVVFQWQEMVIYEHSDLMSQEEENLLEKLSHSLNLTITQQRQLEKWVFYYKLRTDQLPDILQAYLNAANENKFDRNRTLEEIRRLLIQS